MIQKSKQIEKKNQKTTTHTQKKQNKQTNKLVVLYFVTCIVYELM
jgi:hypothetical protein